jgi:N-acetylmuramoyl-L-alanine amidase
MASVEIRNHLIYVDDVPVPYRQTPNGGKPLNSCDGIVLHDTAGDLPGTGSVSWLCNPKAGASAHVVIGYDGSITQLQRLNRQTWHAGASQYKGRQNCNAFTIGIEIANPGAMRKHGQGYINGTADRPGVRIGSDMPVQFAKSANHGPAYWLDYSPEQIETVTELCRAIVREYGAEFITTHWEICVPKGRKVDTNPLFPLDSVRDNVFGSSKPVRLTGDGEQPIEQPEPDADPVPFSVAKPTFFRKVSTWVKAGAVAIGIPGVGALTDAEVVLYLLIFIFTVAAAAVGFGLWLFGKERVANWIRRQVR